MAFMCEALVGHLYIVGGRSISTTPPGALVEVAPKKAARGRETDTFFTLLLPSGESLAPTAFYEQMAELSAERYFNSTGSVTAGLREVFTSLNQDLADHNRSGKRPYEASILCAVLHGDDLYLGKVGSGVAVMRHQGATTTLPADLGDDEQLYGPPLGVQPVPEFRMGRDKVHAGMRLLLADSNLAEIEMSLVNSALDQRDISTALVAIETLNPPQATMMMVEFVLPATPAPVPVQEGESSALIIAAATVGAVARGGTTVAMPTVELPPEPSRYIEVAASAALFARRGVSRLALIVGAILGFLGRTSERLLPEPDEGQKSFLSSPLATGAVVFVPVVVVLAVLILWLAGTGKSEFELCVNETVETAGIARQIASSDVNGTLAGWNAVLATADRCESMRPGDPTLAVLRREGQGIVDRLFSIDRRAAVPIAAFPNAALSRIIIQGQDLFALDDRNDIAYRVTLTADGRGIVPGTQQPFPAMRRGAAVQEFIVGDLLDITWADGGGGILRENVLLALDNHGVLIDCSPRFQQACGAQRLLASENWVEPKAVTFWQGRLYVLDPGANQIWRYEPTGNAYPNAPTEYFFGTDRPSVEAAVDFGIDDNGAIFVLYEDGSLRKFFLGEVQPFGYASFPDGLVLDRAESLFLNTSPIAPGLYITRRDTRTIYETTLAGTFISAYRTFDEAQFATLSGVTADVSREMVYAVSGNSILAFPRTAS